MTSFKVGDKVRRKKEHQADHWWNAYGSTVDSVFTVVKVTGVGIFLEEVSDPCTGFDQMYFDPVDVDENVKEDTSIQKVFIFWSYGGSVTKPILGAPAIMQPDGSFYVDDDYGGMKIDRKSLVAVYPLELGQELWDKVKLASEIADQKIAYAKKELLNQIGDLVPEFKRLSK